MPPLSYGALLCPPRLPEKAGNLALLAARASDFFMPRECAHCSADLRLDEKGPLCRACAEQVRPISPMFCLRCGVPLPDGGAHCFRCRGSKIYSYRCKRVRSAAPFGPQLRSLVHEFKYGFREKLAEPLGSMLAQAFASHPELHDAEMIVPVPLARERLKKRGFNQSELLALVLSEKSAVRAEPGALRKLRDTRAQAGLNREERLKNLFEAFDAEGGTVKGRRILLVDDVATTTATLEACAAALVRAGARRVKGLTLARE